MIPLCTNQTGYREPLPSKAMRKVSMKSRTSCRGFTVGWLEADQWWRRFVYESLLELTLLQLLLARKDVFNLWEQPPVIPFIREDGKPANHWFDVLVTWKNGKKTAIAAKPNVLVEKRKFDEELALIASQTPKAYADEVLLFTDRDFQRWEGVNAARFHQFSKSPDLESDQALTAYIDELNGSLSIADLVARTELRGRGFRSAFKAIFSGELEQVTPGMIDLKTIVKRGAKL